MDSFFSEWLQHHFYKAGDGPAYQRLYGLICRAILAGKLKAATRLPSSRALAAELGIARNTVLQVYEQLAEEGYVSAAVGSGTFVLDISQDLIDADPMVAPQPALQPRSQPLSALSRRGSALAKQLGFSNRQAGAFMPGVPDVREFPLKAWARIQNRIWRSQPWDLLRYAPAGGYGPLRHTISAYLNSVRSVQSSAQQVIMTTGIHQSVDMCIRMLCDPGDIVWIEEPGYWGVRSLLLMAGLRPVPIPVDDEGLLPAPAHHSQPPRLIVVSPSHQYPLGKVMSLARRRMLLDYARQVKCWVLEDDYDSDFRYGSRPLPSLQGMDDSGRVLYVGSFSKTLAPGLRLGFLVVPPALAPAFANALAELYREGDMMTQAVLDQLIQEGHLAAHVRRMRRRYSERRSCLIAAIEQHFGTQLEIIGGDAGLHLILALPAGVDDEVVARHALQKGVLTRPLSAYYSERAQARSGLLLGYAGVSPAEIRPAFDTLAAVIGKYLEFSQPKGGQHDTKHAIA